MSTNYDDKVEEEIPGMVYVLAFTDEEEDEEMNPVVSDVKEYELPNAFVGGEKSSAGSCTSALLATLKKAQKKKDKMMAWADCLEGMQEHIKEHRGLRTYIPTLSTSRPIDIRNEPIRIATASSSGVKRALLIGIHYEENDEDDVHLSSCHDNVRKMREFIIHEHGFEKQNILVILDDDGRHHAPTKKFILDSLIRLCEISEPGDSIFVQFSGHGGRLMDGNDKYNEDGTMHDLLATSDYHEKGIGPIIDDELYSLFVTKIPAGVECIAVIDPLHPPPSGNKSSALELPYMCEAGDDEVCHTNGFSPGRTRKFLASAAAVATVAGGVAAAKNKKKKRSDKDEKVKKKTKKNKKDNKKPKKKTKKEAIDDNDDDDNNDNSDNENVMMHEDSDEEYVPEASESKKKNNMKKKKGSFGLRGDKEEKKKKHEDDDKSSIEEGDCSDEEEKKQKKKKKKGVSGLRCDKEEKKKKPNDDDDDDDNNDESFIEEENYSDEEEKKQKKKNKKGGFGLCGDKQKKKKQDDNGYDDDDKSSIEEENSSDGEEEKQKKKKKKGVFGLRVDGKKKTKKNVKQQEIVESDDDGSDDNEGYSESSDEDEPLLEEPKKKKKGFFGLRGKNKK